jgi:hypothetical protein
MADEVRSSEFTVKPNTAELDKTHITATHAFKHVDFNFLINSKCFG